MRAEGYTFTFSVEEWMLRLIMTLEAPWEIEAAGLESRVGVVAWPIDTHGCDPPPCGWWRVVPGS